MKGTFMFFSFLLWFGPAELKPRRGSGVVCTFKDKTFSPGDSWHPYLEPFGFMFCVRCVCAETGHVKCSTIRCPALPCEDPVTETQRCCPRCTDEPRIPAGLRASARFCRHNGSVYQPGETFTKHDLFPSRQSNQCAMCTCSNGNIFCALKTCQPITCPSPVPVADTCCLVCKDHGSSGLSSAEDGSQQLNRGVRHSVDQCSTEPNRVHSDSATPPRIKASPRAPTLGKLNLRGSSETTVKFLLQRKHQKVCLYNGRTYSHGDMWHPVLGKVLECILCTCTDGLQDCKRIMCPGQYPCKHPIKTAGKCCKTCPDSKADMNQTRCFSGYKNNLLVYKVESSLTLNPPNSMRIIAVQRQSTAEVEVQVWSAAEGVLQIMEVGDVLRKDITDHPENYKLLTTLDEETWRKFKEEGKNLSTSSGTAVCEDGIREIMTFLNPKLSDDLCSP
ncbi:chordin-like protein 2 [Nematolebias whitei]|uniref:chordin-like protein 2 n=1 Tax=Nematolebias whitei TaxID=451745 RepID=UPI00189AD450|nr:chordin-like protein 2 [Nematolebias whitei]